MVWIVDNVEGELLRNNIDNLPYGLRDSTNFDFIKFSDNWEDLNKEANMMNDEDGFY